MVDVGGAIGSVLLLGADDEVTYNWFHNGRGTGGLDSSADGWAMVRKGYTEVLLLVAQGLAESRAAWTGAAADATHGAVSPVRVWAENALDAAVTAQATVSEQSRAFSDIKGRLSPPVNVPDKPWYNDMWPGDTNYDSALREKQANSLRNVELVRQYGDMTVANGASYPQFEEPVVITTDVARPEQPGQPVQPRDSGAVEWRTGPRQPGDSGQPQPGSPGGDPDQPSTVAGPPPGGGPAGQPVNPSQSVPSGQTSPPVPTSPSVGQDPAPGRNPGTGVPVAGLPGVPGRGAPEGSSGGRAGVPGSGGRPGGGGVEGRPGSGGRPGGGAPGEPGAGGRSGIGPGGRGVPAGEAAAGRGVAGAARGGAGQPGFVPGAGRAAGDEDSEHTNKFGPVDEHEDFWEGGMPLVAPPVIGGPEDR